MATHRFELDPAEAYAVADLEGFLRNRYPDSAPAGLTILRRSLDARGSRPLVSVLAADAGSPEAVSARGKPFEPVQLPENAPVLNIIGAGPAGLFAALRCLERGWRPVVWERGQAVRERRREVALLSREGRLNPESNYCYGEGGAGTFSDGKLYTRATKRGDVATVLRLLVDLGAPVQIMYDAHPHIGTNKLPALIEKARQTVLEGGGCIHFNKRVVGLERVKTKIRALELQNGERIPVETVMLCTGHSARDVFDMLLRAGLELQAKPLAMGVRIEHPQDWINRWRYRREGGLTEGWPAASYAVVEQVDGRGVYSFCMCPGGIMAPCSTSVDQVVTNGWSPSKRNNRTANAGWVTEIHLADIPKARSDDPLALLRFQEQIERNALTMGGGHQWAPAQNLRDFVFGRPSALLEPCSYRPGTKASELHRLYPPAIQARLANGLKQWAKKWPRLFDEGAVVAGPESRTSSPVRVPRVPVGLHHPDCTNLYPVGEGAGYAGGIMSAILDARRSVDALSVQYPNP
ncbi:MAG: FAD-binding protein [Cytophagia bacterium]|nr:FAD-binding protein [Cytophagia bacterium]